MVINNLKYVNIIFLQVFARNFVKIVANVIISIYLSALLILEESVSLSLFLYSDFFLLSHLRLFFQLDRHLHNWDCLLSVISLAYRD